MATSAPRTPATFLKEALGRPVWTHEFGLNLNGLKAELVGEQPPPSMQEIIELIPEHKRLIVEVEQEPKP